MKNRRRLFYYSLLLLLLIVIPIFLLNRGYQHQKLNHELIVAIRKGDASAVQAFLAQGADVNARAGDSDVSLMQMLKRLFARQRTIPSDDKDPSNQSALKLLLVQAAPIWNEPDTLSKYDTIAETLILHGADTHIYLQVWGTPLDCAATWGMPKMVAALLSQGADPNEKDRDGTFALRLADQESTILLLRYGANPNQTAMDGSTPLMCACQGGEANLGRVQLLLDAGANPNAKDNDGITPLMDADEPDIADCLIQYGADVNARNNDGESVLDYRGKCKRMVTDEEYNRLINILKQHGAR